MLNKFICVGRWSKDLELRYSKEGKAVASSNIAINDRYNKDNTTFLPVVMFGKVAENAAQFTQKGSLVLIEGKVNKRSYDGKDGKKVYVTEIVADNVQFLGGKQQNNDPFADDGAPFDISSEDLPF